jgi:4-hydroxythreonine-4-phosphate dehydrogenase
MIRAVFTCGDINGIGPVIAIKVFSKIFSAKNHNQIIYICPKNVFQFYYHLLNAQFDFIYINSGNSIVADKLNIISLPDNKISFGKVTASAGKTAYNSLLKAIGLIQNNFADVLITSPLSKEAVNKSGIKFIGHTELLAESEINNNYLMTFVSKEIIASLLTIHKPIRKVADLITKEKIISSIKLLNNTARQDFGIINPKIAVLGLNPHAGENGLIGNEEQKSILPVINSLKRNINVSGPFVPDAFWGNKIYKKFNLILGMYHDQVLIPFKMLNFNTGVNYTAGLNMIRTSPDHGTAFDIAGQNLADPSSLFEAYNFAIKIFKNRKKYLAASKNK